MTVEHEIFISGNERATYLASQFQTTGDNLLNLLEYACAKGGIVLKPYPDGDKIVIDVVQVDNFFPVALDGNGNITATVFPEFKTKGKILYTRLEHHWWEDGVYHISNKAFRSSNAQVKVNDIVNPGEEIALTMIPE